MNNERFHGILQAAGGAAEAAIGLTTTVTSAGTLDGLNRFFTDLKQALSGNQIDTVTSQLLQKTGLSHNAATNVDNILSIGGTGLGLRALRTAQLASFPRYSLPEHTLTGQYTKYNSNLSRTGGASRNRLVPDSRATGAHSVFRRDTVSGRITHYETFRPQTNSFNPKPWESVMRFDNAGKAGVSHFNKILDKWIYEPHVHDTLSVGEIRPAETWEIPR